VRGHDRTFLSLRMQLVEVLISTKRSGGLHRLSPNGE
jgi:hypothetical protein